tara:strand:- start:327 stop:551 length:225 start_codon:yes stop_codon:yes gene_type:complete
MKKNEDKTNNPHQSPIPPHLTPEERAEWERDAEYEKKEKERRRQEGLYGRRKFRKRRGRPPKSLPSVMRPFHEM